MERNTNRFWWMALPALLALMALPQLFYFWLAPAMAAASWLVHGVGTVLTLALPLYACLLCWRYGLRRAAGAAVLAGAAQAFTILVGAVLLAVNASLRTAGFALAAMTLAILGVLIPMAAATAHSELPAVQPLDWLEPEEPAADDRTECADDGYAQQAAEPSPVLCAPYHPEPAPAADPAPRNKAVPPLPAKPPRH